MLHSGWNGDGQGEAGQTKVFKRIVHFEKKLQNMKVSKHMERMWLFPTKKYGLVGCGDLSFQQKISALGAAYKGKTLFCTYRELESNDHDLLHYVSGDKVCAI